MVAHTVPTAKAILDGYIQPALKINLRFSGKGKRPCLKSPTHVPFPACHILQSYFWALLSLLVD